MANRIRSGVFHSAVGLGLLIAPPLFAQTAAAPQEAAIAALQREIEWLAALPAPPKVVDANGKFVGWPRTSVFSDPFVGEQTGNGVERNVNGVWIVIPANVSGFASFIFTFLFTSSDCSGATYLGASTLPPDGWVATNPPANTTLTLFFPGAPVRLLNINSYHVPGATCSTLGAPAQFQVGPAQSVNLNSLGLVPPFTVK